MKLRADPKSFILRALLLAAAALTLAPLQQAQAHQLWLEADAETTTLFFGEFGENLREASPGLLDKFVKVTAYRQQAQARLPLEVRKTSRGFVLAGTATPGEPLLAEDVAYPIFERKQGDQTLRSLYHPAARISIDTARQAPLLTLDLVPTGVAQAAGDVQVQAYYRGQPLPKAKVAIVTASGWALEHRTDAQGLLTVRLPWQGSYVLERSHADTHGAERDGVKVDRANYVTSLTLVRAQGLPALPAALPAKPD
jgi:hypothetical protein